MRDKVALVTGGMGGISAIIAHYLYDHGASVAATYNQSGNHELAREWQQQQQNEGYEFEIFYTDLVDFDSVN